ncbi:TonB-dependent receptor [Mucilaginibacter mali]|uniref:TonB-dependent receptor n=1 Tax=Mucilaginibacter mali TaxID=2740462 RepID=A0A7D4QE14_9SPHI|nr:TonB-dependent receptor [Mucilaginibacter mali]QKJ29372.1 TonB-dependent receptor [Mucilaginibacter mali]
MMKLTMIILTMAIIQVSAASFAQKITLKKTNASLEQVFDDIRNQSGYDFFYNLTLIKSAKPVTVNIKNAELEDALAQIFNNQPLTYTITREDKAVVIKERKAPAPPHAVTGKVVDEQGTPLIGVVVKCKVNNAVASTDVNGNFTITVPDDNAVLSFTYIGYKPIEIAAGHSSLSITMQQTVSALNEVVVVGYGTQKRTDLTGALSSVSNDKLVATHFNNAIQSLAGQLPGVDVTTSSTKPGGGFDISIRGQNTIKSGTDLSGINPPLYVLDGIYVSSINDISPTDIERIDVLKDASSTAIYGSRGANGVVIVTTRKGKQGKNSVEYIGSASVNSVMNLPHFTTATEWVQYRIDRSKGQNYTNPAYEPNLATLLGQAAYNNYQAGNSISWPDEILKKSYTQSHAVSLNGSAEKLTYSLGAAINSEKGEIEGDGYTRYNVSAALNKQINNTFKIGTNIYTAYEIATGASPETFRTIYRLNPLTDKYNADGSLKFYPDGITTITNPFLEEKNRHTQTNNTHVFGNMYLEVKPLNWLKFTTTFAPDINHTEGASYIGSMTKTGAGALANSSAQYQAGRTIKYTWDNLLQADKTWGDHSVNLLLGASQYKSAIMTSAEAARAFPTDAYDWYNLGAGTMSSMSTNYIQEQLSSFFGRVNYDYKGRYLLTATARTDGSSKLAEGHKWAFFPSAALGWRISEEEFLKDKTALSNLKLRFSYGVSGNNGVSPYSSFPTVANARYLFGTTSVVNTSSVTRFANKNLTWERTNEFNLGVDFELYKGRIGGTIDVYNRRTNGIIMNRVMSILNGFTSLTDNVGSVNNKGIEFSLNTTNVKTDSFSWNTSLNVASNSNKIVSLADGSQRDEANGWFVGQPVGVVWTYDQVGYWSESEAADAKKYGLAPGSIKVRDIDNSGTINNADKVFKGSLFPKWTGGITNSFAYKNIDLAFTVTTRQGQYSYSQFHGSYSLEDNENFNVLKLNYWTPQNTSGTWVRPGVPSGPMEVLYFQKTAYVRVGYINAGYNLPKGLIGKVGLSKLRVFASCQNPFIFTDYAGWDPEIAGRDTQTYGYPMTRKFMFGLDLAF